MPDYTILLVRMRDAGHCRQSLAQAANISYKVLSTRILDTKPFAEDEIIRISNELSFKSNENQYYYFARKGVKNNAERRPPL